MNICREYRQSARDFDVWIHQTIWASNLFKDIRLHILEDFTDDLTKWMKQLGYSMNEDWGLRAVAQWLYALAVVEQASWQSKRRIRYPSTFNHKSQEDSDYFDFIVNMEEVDLFRKRWISVEDFEPDTSVGSRMWLELPTFLYCYVDLENSKNGEYIRSKFQSSDSDSDGASVKKEKQFKKPTDLYFQDMQSGFHGGDWSKV